MKTSSWLRRLRDRLTAPGSRRRAWRPGLERLEDRTVPSTLQGTVFDDLNQNGARDPGEPGLGQWVVYLDADHNGQWTDGEAWQRTDAAGAYSFSGLPAGSHTVVAMLREPSYARTQPADGSQTVSFATDTETVTGLDFGNRLTARGAARPEFRVNTTTAGSQKLNGGISPVHHAVAADAAGNFVVVWAGNGPGDPDGVFAQRYGADGTARGAEFRVNTTTAGSQGYASVAADANGNFVVTWESGNDVKARLYYGNGNARTGEFPVKNRAVVNDVAMDATGDFVVTYEESKNPFTMVINAQRYNAAGAAQGKAINFTTTNLGNDNASVAMDRDGDFVVAWTTAFQRVDRFGNKQGPVVNLPDAGPWPTVAMDAAGNFIVAWANYNLGLTEARLYFANGTPRGGVFPIDPASAGYPAVAMGTAGEFTVAWLGGSPYEDVYVRRFGAAGTPLGDSVVANTLPYGGVPAVAMGGGTAAVVWNGLGAGDDQGVFGQVYSTGSALLAEGGAKAGGPGASALMGAGLRPLVDEAVRRWQAAGLSAGQAALLRCADIRIADLGGVTLGLASGRTIWLDDDAAGWGWFVDPTPRDDREFTAPGDQGEQRRMDLLSVLMHEMGHALGLDHDAAGVMQESLPASTRRLPTAAQASTLAMPVRPRTGGFPSAPLGAAHRPLAPSALDRESSGRADWDALAVALSLALDPRRKS